MTRRDGCCSNAQAGWVRYSLTGMLLLLLPSQALADAAPPPDYEEDCTRAKQEADAEFCEARPGSYMDRWGCYSGTQQALADDQPYQQQCGANAADAAQAACCPSLLDGGWRYRCRGWGGSAWETLWCRARVAGDPSRPASPNDDPGCRLAAGPLGGASLALCALALLGLLWLRNKE